MDARLYSHPIFFQWYKKFVAVLAFVFPPYMIWNSFMGVAPIHSLTEIVVTIFLSLFMMIPILVSAYFWQDIWVDEEGLLVEFLWKKIRVRWIDIIETETAWGFLGRKENRSWVVMVNGLTPFHRMFGVLYGLSLQPAFVIDSSIRDFQALKDIIRKHTNAA